MTRYTALGSGILVTMLLGSSASADTWENWRKDNTRVAESHGEVGSGEVSVRWRMRLGGYPADGNVLFAKGGRSVFLAAAGGHITARDVRTGRLLWESAFTEEQTLVAVDDVDGDGVEELVTFDASRVHLFSMKDGEQLWQSPVGQYGRIVSVRVADLDGDGLKDALIDDCAACGIPSPELEGAYSFAAGARAPRKLWGHPTVPGSNVGAVHSGIDGVYDLDGDGAAEVGLPHLGYLSFHSGQSGLPLVTLPVGGHTQDWFAQASSFSTGPGEVLLLRTEGYAGSGTPGLVEVVDVDLANAAAVPRWEWFEPLGSSIQVGEDALGDFDGNGERELAVSVFAPEGGWSTKLLNYATGAQVAGLPGWWVDGAIQGAAGAKALVMAGAEGLVTAVWDGEKIQLVGAPRAGLRGVRVAPQDGIWKGSFQTALGQVTSATGEPWVLAGVPTTSAPGASLGIGRYDALELLEVTEAGWGRSYRYAPSRGAVTAVLRADGMTRPYPQFAVGLSTGEVQVLDRRLRSTQRGNICGKPEGRGFPAGSLEPARANLIGELSGRPYVVIPNSADGVWVGDVSRAGVVGGAAQWWTSKTLTLPAILRRAGESHVVGIDGADVVVRTAETGVVAARAPVGSPGRPMFEPMVLNRGNGEVAIAFDWRLPSVEILQKGFAWGPNSIEPAWEPAPIAFGGTFLSSAGDYLGLGYDQWISAMWGYVYERSARDGSVARHYGYHGGYSLSMITDLDGKPGNELLMQAGGIAPVVWGANWSPRWSSQNLGEYNNLVAGARVTCSVSVRYATPFQRSSRVRIYDAATGTVTGEKWLAGGAAYGSLASARAAAPVVGALSNFSSLARPGQDGWLLAGSTDGWLYALDACGTGDVVWTKNLGAPLGEPSIGDWDGDGEEELLVGASSGHLIGLDFGQLGSPTVTLNGHGNGATVVVNWDPIPGAKNYEVALVDATGAPVWDQPYRTIKQTRFPIHTKGLVPGRPFRLAVRAVGEGGDTGAEAFSPEFSSQDRAAPRLRVVAARDGSVAYDVKDDSCLDYWIAFLRTPGDEEHEFYVDDDLLSGTEGRGRLNLTIPSELRGGPLELVFRAIDASGAVSEATLLGRSTGDGQVTWARRDCDGRDARAPWRHHSGGGRHSQEQPLQHAVREKVLTRPDARVSGDVPPAVEMESGCAVSPGARGDFSWWGWLLGVGLLARTTRRRKPHGG